MLINDASITGSLIVNASASFQNISVSGNILPDVDNLRNIGSTDKYFKEIYVSTGSINFVDNGEVVAVLSAGTINAIQVSTSSANDRLNAIENFTSSLNTTYTTDAELNASSSALTSNINTKLNSSSFNSFTASISATNTFTSSATARLNSIEATTASFTTIVAGINVKTGSYATTGSNSFNGNQTITGSLTVSSIATISSSYVGNNSSMTLNSGSNLYVQNGGAVEITGSLKVSGSLNLIGTTNLATTGSNTFFGTQTFSGSVYIKENLIVQGSSSLQNITASAVDIGTNKIILNVNNPAVRYAGISVYDSGSTSGTGSLWWDSVNNYWLYEHPEDSAAPYNSAIMISGPKNAGNLGEEVGLNTNYIMKAIGGDHISSSAIYDDGTTISLKSNTQITGSLIASQMLINTTNVADKFVVKGSGYYYTAKFYTTGVDTGLSNGVYIAAGTNSSDIALAVDTQASSPILYARGNGNVGIGDTNPGSKLTLNAGTTDQFGFAVDSNSSFAFGSTNGRRIVILRNSASEDNGLQFGTDTVDNTGIIAGSATSTGAGIDFYTYNGSDWGNRVRIAKSGKVGIGTTNPGFKLHVLGSSEVISYFQTTGTYAPISWTGDNGTTKGGVIAHGGNVSIGGLNSAGTGIDGDKSLTIKSGSGFVGINTTSVNVPLTISTTGDTTDGTFYSTLTINNTGTSTFSRVRFDRSGVARWGLTLANDDTFRISNLYENGSVTANDATFAIKNNNFVGIGTANPSARLQIIGGNIAEGQLYVGNTDVNYTAGINFYTSTSNRGFVGWRHTNSGAPFSLTGIHLFNTDNSNIVFGTNNTIKAVIDVNGNVGIGVTNPSFKLHLRNTTGDDGTWAGGILIENTGSPAGEPAIAFKNIATNGNYVFAGLNQSNNFSIAFGSSFTDANTKLQITPGGQILTWGNPAFMAYGNGNASIDYNGTYLIFPSVHVNRGGHYNASNGVFTAPVTGIYFFSWADIAGNGNDVYRFFIRVNDTTFLGDYHHRIDITATGSEYGTNGNRNAIINLNAGDTVRIWFRNDGGATLYGINNASDSYHNFMGYLIG